ncbi:hypothetical protein COY87_01560 [Candidatus Roizmanbacteria bacterium CG_4_10_14_0_8_um_filter_33_9]|uniref:Uncharacterized protein n=1 Tax=Candidatus Roizmanbacteria bacterium CG_4_10_14_0_8_um_filter_33_9 TaxID=1974826 RepID=A0A2M7QK43_9BACT|nr:MAG: hypothetical protein COY87_01560 [Candidatus Roizmanbacteria bacterium CG_4_10_14_0_8_um_filter_33_9]
MAQTETYSQIKQKSIVSTVSLFIQSGYSAFLGLVANLVVTIILSPKIFGIYITTLSIISVLNYFSDIGLAASLVQKKEVTKDDIKTTFTIQQILIISIIGIGFILTNFIKTFYKLPTEGITLYWALLIAFFISSLKTIPSIFLERKIQFQKIVFVQMIENTIFYLTVILFAFLKFGLLSFAIAVLLRAFVGLVVIYSISFWIPKIGISSKSLKKLLSFGLPFQASSFLALFKDDLIILFLGKILGFEALGYIGWAKKWAEAPIRIIMDNISRVLFPVFARIQNNKEKVAHLVEKIIQYQTSLLTPIILGMALIMDKVVFIIPKYGKWAPAIPLFYLFCISAFFSSYSSPFINLFNALGYAKIPFIFMTIWTISTWILTPLLTKLFGIYGFPITIVIMSVSSIFVMLKAKQIVKFDLIGSVYKPILSTIIMGISVSIILLFVQNPYLAIILSFIFGSTIYFFSMKNIFNINLITELKTLIKK